MPKPARIVLGICIMAIAIYFCFQVNAIALRILFFFLGIFVVVLVDSAIQVSLEKIR